MRFPWLQVDVDFLEATAGDLGAMLGVSRREAVGLCLDLWSWCLKRSPNDRPPDGVILDGRSGTGAVPVLERAGGWTGPEGKLAAALEDCGLLERVAGGVRLRGIGRYTATWKKNRNGRGTGPEPGRNRAGYEAEPEPKTQTQTQKEEPLAGSLPASAGQQGEDLPEADPQDVVEVAEEATRPQLELVSPPADLEPKASSRAQDARKPAPRPTAAPEELQALWNELAPPKGLSRWESMSKPRRAAAKLHLEHVPDMGRWRAYLTAKLAEPFFLGANDRGWKADVDWLLRAERRDQVADFNPAAAPAASSAPKRFVEM